MGVRDEGYFLLSLWQWETLLFSQALSFLLVDQKLFGQNVVNVCCYLEEMRNQRTSRKHLWRTKGFSGAQ